VHTTIKQKQCDLPLTPVNSAVTRFNGKSSTR